MPRTSTIRVEFFKEHDTYLAKYLARYCPSKEGRRGCKIFQTLVANEEERWPWSVHHTWQSWRERYVKNSDHFDALILKYQAKHGIKPIDTRKRGAGPMSIEMLESSAKRIRLDMNKEEEEEEEVGTSGGIRIEQQPSSSSKPISKSTPRQPREPNVRPLSPQRSGASSNNDATKLTRGTIEISSLPPNRQTPPLADGVPSPHSTKHLRKRSRVPSEVFASEPSSPKRDADVASAGGPSSRTQQVPPAPGTVSDDTPVSYPRAPPRVVDSFHGQVLVDRKGHVPLPRNGGEQHEVEEVEVEVEVEVEEEEIKDQPLWPPPRGRFAKQASGPDVQVDAHHPFSQTKPRPRSPKVPRESAEKGERKQQKPLGHAPLPDRRVVAAQFLGEVGHARNEVASQIGGERPKSVVPNGSSPVKRTAPPTPDPFSGLPKLSSKVLKFPTPRALTESPFRPESPTREARGPSPPAQPEPLSRSWTKAARHPALTRIRRQTIQNGQKNGRKRERRREHREVPSVDLVALSRSSMSIRSHSHSSTGASAPVKPSRWSLPMFVHATPWTLDEPRSGPSATGSALGSSSGSPFRWAAPSPAYGDTWRGRDPTRTSTSRSGFALSPGRSIAGSHLDVFGSPLSSFSFAPHPSDLALTASHGLASILAHMSANHGLAIGVVEAVYRRVGSLSEADEVLRGMREAAEGFGEREIERRLKKRGKAREGERRDGGGGSAEREGSGREEKEAALRYVVASEDGEGSEYSPPETSRAALWKQQAESGGYSEGENKEEEEGQAVEEGLRDVERGNENEARAEGLAVEHHEFSQRVPTLAAVNGENRNNGEQDGQIPKGDTGQQRTVEQAWVEHIPAQALERRMGRGQFRRDVVKRFI